MAYRSSVEFSGRPDDDNDPDIVYYNATIINDNALNQTALGLDPVVRFQETRSTALINNIANFNFSIIRFTMNGANKDLPMFIPSVQIGQSDINLTSYSVGVQFAYKAPVAYGSGGGFVAVTPTFASPIYSQAFIEFQTETQAYFTQNVVTPNAPLTEQDIRGVYYYVYTYQHWLNLVNSQIITMYTDMVAPNTYFPFGSLPYIYSTAWATANPTHSVATFSALPSPSTTGFYFQTQDTGFFYVWSGTAWVQQTDYSALFLDLGAGASAFAPPSFSWDNGSKLFTINYPSYFQTSEYNTAGQNTANFWMNTNMYGLFTNFVNEYYGNESNGQVNQMIVQPIIGFGGASNEWTLSSNDYISMKQDYESVSSLWSPIESIVFTSTLIPIFPENVGEPIYYGQGNDYANINPSTSAFQPIVTDIALAVQEPSDYRGFIEYLPTAEYRLSAFTTSRQELRNIDIQVFWKSRLDNNLYPVRMFNLSSVSIKMMFRKKNMGKGN